MFFGMWDWLYLKGRIQVFNELHKNLIGNDKIEEPYWGPSCSHVVTQLIELVT